MNQHQFLFSVFFFYCDLENKKIEEGLKSRKKWALALALLTTVIMQMTELLQLVRSFKMTCGVNVFIVRMEHAINTKTSIASKHPCAILSNGYDP